MKFHFSLLALFIFFFTGLPTLSQEHEVPIQIEPVKKRGFKGSVEFTPEEISKHFQRIQPFTREAAACLQWHMERQEFFWEKYKLAAFYGYESDWNRKVTIEEKKAFFIRRHVPLEVLDEIKPISCVNMTLDCLERSFKKTGQMSAWVKVKDFTAANNQYGNALQFALQKLGWKILYWNPDTSKVAEWDHQERERDKKIREGDEPENQFGFYGWHADRLRQVREKKQYYFNPVDDGTSLVDFGASPPRKFLQLPFFVGTAHTGFHVFPGYKGIVVEGHNRARITDRRTVESAPFDPLGQIPTENGKPRFSPNGGLYGVYRSGLIAAPPGYGY